jgi:hypothetical protein
MALSLERIKRAREAGFDDDKIVGSIERNDPQLGARIKKAREAGYDSAAIMQSIEKRLNPPPQTQQPTSVEAAAPQPEVINQDVKPLYIEKPQEIAKAEENVKPLYMAGTQESITPQEQVAPTQDKSFWDWVTSEPVEDSYEKMIRPKEYTPEQLQKMSVQERYEYAQDLNRHMEYMRSKGITKGALSGLTFGLSEKIPALRPERGEHGVLFGELLGSVLPIEGLAKVIGWPLVKLAGSSPKYKAALESFLRISGLEPMIQTGGAEILNKALTMGATGALYEGAKEAIKKGELPSAQDLVEHGASWALLDMALNSTGLYGRFASALKNHPDSPVKRINQLVEKVNLNENNPEILRQKLGTAIDEIFPERAALTKEAEASAKQEVLDYINEMPKGNKKNVAQDAFNKQHVRNPKQLQQFLEEYDLLFPAIRGKTMKDRNRKFVNKYSESNIDQRNFSLTEEGGNVPIPRMSETEKLKRFQLELREAKLREDKPAIKEAKKKVSLQKAKVQRLKMEEERAKLKNPRQLSDEAVEDLPVEQANEVPAVEPEAQETNVKPLYKGAHASPSKFAIDTSGESGEVVGRTSGIGTKNGEVTAAQALPQAEKSAKINVSAKPLSITNPSVKAEAGPKPIIETTGEGAAERLEYAKSALEENVEKANNLIKAAKTPSESLKRLGKATNEAIFNFMAPLENLERNTPVAQRVSTRIKLAQSAASEVNSVLENGIFSNITGQFEHQGLKGAYGELTWKKLTKGLKPHEYSLQELDTYRASRAALRRQQEGKKTGIDTAKARQDVERLRQKYGPIDQRIREYNQKVLERYGQDLIGGKLIEEWNRNYYAPLYRVMDSGENSILKAGSLKPKQPFKAMKGSERKIIPPSESDPYNTSMLISNSKKNDAILQYKRLVERGQVPGTISKAKNEPLPKGFLEELGIDPEIADLAENLYNQTRKNSYTPKKNTLRGWEDGKPFDIEVPEEIYNVFSTFAPQDSGFIARFFGASNRLFSRGISLSPKKSVSIFARDALSSLIYSRTGANPISIVEALGDIYGDKEVYKQFMAMGGDVYAARLAQRIDRTNKIEDLITPGKEGILVPFEKIGGWFKSYAEKLGEMSMAVPLAEYKRALKIYGDTAEGRLMAAMEARRVTYDPTRKGASKIVRELGNYIPFWNVSLQDLATLGSALKRPETWAKGFGAITIPTLMLKMLNEHNPEYQALTPVDKAAFWHLYFGDKHVRIPIPWLLGTAFKVGPEAFFDIAQQRGGEGWQGLWNNFLDNLSGDIPPIVQTYVEWQTGKSLPSPVSALLGGESNAPEVVPRRLQNLPPKYQYTSKTSQLARKFGEIWNISPMKLERAIKSNTGTLGADALALIDEIAYQTGWAEDKRPAQRESNYLLLGNFVSNSPASRTKYANQFYEMLESARHSKEEAKRGGEGSSEKFKRLSSYNAKISKKFQEYRAIEDSKIKPDVKKQQLDAKQREINALYKEAVEKYK